MNLKEKRAAALKAAQAIVDAAKGRDMTDEEQTALDGHVSEVKSLDAQIAKAEKSSELIKSIGELAPEQEIEAPSQVHAKSLGEWFVKNAGEKLKGVSGSKFTVAAPEFKAASDVTVTGGNGGVWGPVLTDVDRNIVTGVRRRLTIADLLGTEAISGSAITYFVEGALEGDFTTVAEGGQKPQLHYADPTAVTEALTKLAAFIKESDELSEDLPFLATAINGRLLYNLGLFEENQLLSGNGTGTNIRGILNRTGVQTEAAATADDGKDNADAMFRAITKVSTGSGLDADGIVLNPADYQSFRLSKDGNGQYFGGGFFAGEYGNGGITVQPPLWGLRTVVTPAITAGTALVGAFAQAGSVIRKGGVRVESTNSNDDDFTNNRITIRAEERIALAVRRPSGFVKVTLDYTASV